MKPLYDYITASSSDMKDTVVVTDYNLKESPLDLGNKIYKDVQEFAEGQVKEKIVDEIGKWYEDAKNRRNVVVNTAIDVRFYLIDKDNKLLMNIIDELKRIGVYGEPGEFNSIGSWGLGGVNCGACNIKFSVPTYKQFKEGNYKYDVVNNVSSPYFKTTSYGNGYNGLSKEDITSLRQKLYDCMNGTKYEVKEFPGKRNRILSFIVALTAQYDKRKLKEFLSYLQNDKRLQNFATRHEQVSRGIDAYYASKNPGDYVGD